MLFMDRTTLTDKRVTSDGALVAFVRCARTGCQDYAGYEVGKPDLPKVTVFRPESEVFAADAMASFAHAPVTFDHPPESVTTDNWKKFAVGQVGEDVVRDGEAVRVPMMVRDAGTIRAIDRGVNEISMGYICDLEWGDGSAPDGTAYQATQRNIRINHLAIVDRARGGPSLKIGDNEMTTKTITFDGLPLLVTDAAEAVINKLNAKIADGDKALADKQAEHDRVLAAKDAEIDKLKGQVIDEATIDKRATEKADVIAKAAKIADGLDTAGKTVAEIRRMTVAKKLGDAAVADKSDDYVAARFDGLLDAVPADKLRGAIKDGHSGGNFNDNSSVRDLARAAQY